MVYCQKQMPLQIHNWAELWLVIFVYTVLVKIQLLERIVYTSRFWIIFEKSQIWRQLIGIHRRSILHATKSSQMPYTEKLKKIMIQTAIQVLGKQ